MAKRGSSNQRPTTAELAVLRVLWQRGSATVREVHDELAPRSEVTYTTTLKTMQVMAKKGLVRRDERARSHVYSARVSEERTQRRLVRTLLDQAFDGSRAKLLLRALSDRPVDAAELAELRRLLRQVEQRED